MRLVYALCLLAACSFPHGVATSSGDDDMPIVDGVVDAPPDTPPGAWWDAAWPVRMPITITNASTTESLAAGYQVGFQFTLAPNCNSRDDVRIIRNHTTELDRVIDDGGPWFWFKLQSAIAPGASSIGEYFIYCGNPAPTNVPNAGKTVFDFFDGFNGASIDAAVWTVSSGAALANNKLVVGNAAGNDHGIITKSATFTANHAVDFEATTSAATGNAFWAGFENSTNNAPPWLIWWTNTTTIIAPAYKANGGSTDWRGTAKTLDTNAHIYSIENFGKHAIFRIDNTAYETHTYDANPPAAFNIRLWNYNSTPTVTYDNVRIRQVIDPAPTVMVGAVEMKP
jgi:hypothetical protein